MSCGPRAIDKFVSVAVTHLTYKDQFINDVEINVMHVYINACVQGYGKQNYMKYYSIDCHMVFNVTMICCF